MTFAMASRSGFLGPKMYSDLCLSAGTCLPYKMCFGSTPCALSLSSSLVFGLKSSAFHAAIEL